MKTRVIEATTGETGNHGKFLIGKFDHEWQERQAVEAGSKYPLLGPRWQDKHFLMLDLETGEGALFVHGGFAEYDLDKHAVWVCPLFSPTLQWLYVNWDGEDVDAIPRVIRLTFEEAPFAMAAPRRPGRRDPLCAKCGYPEYPSHHDPRMPQWEDHPFEAPRE